MAERRMLSKRVLNSARFLRMPLSTQALYMHLNINADDDGIVEAFAVLRMIGASDDDLKVLEARQFVVILNEDLVTYIVDWRENNYIRSDRKINSIYIKLLQEKLPNVEVLQSTKKPKAEEDDGQMSGTCQASDGQMSGTCPSNDGIGKDRIGKVSISQDSIEEKPPRHKYGEYNNVLLTDTDLEKLKAEYPKDWEERINRLSEYMASSGKSYKNHLATIRNWARREKQESSEAYVVPDDGLMELLGGA